ncbi:MAG: pyridoxine kinase [Caulobacterales bacterium 68-7]|nr:MAG: pyridoxine kinase [Caulobacterales bacterium 68-7]
MPLALVLSSHVAGSRVGGSAQAAALAPFKIDAMVVPTVLFGRHPGWGPPGGAAVPIETFEGMLTGVEANGLFGKVDAAITGYFRSPEQVQAAARAIDAVRAAPRDGAYSPAARIIIDPTLGDAGKGLYVPVEVAEAVVAELLPRADLIAPNAWELQHLTGQEIAGPESAVRAAQALGKPVLVSSIPTAEGLGVVHVDGEEAWLAAHPSLPHAPNGVGDLLTALFAAQLIEGREAPEALAHAVGGLYETVAAARDWGAPELPIVAMGARLMETSPAVRTERLA